MEKEQERLCGELEGHAVNSGYSQTVEQRVNFFFCSFYL